MLVSVRVRDELVRLKIICDILMLKNTVCSTLNILVASRVCTYHFPLTVLLTLCVRVRGLTACAHVFVYQRFPQTVFFSHPLSPSCMCVTLCLCSIPPVFHAHLLIRISTGRKDPHSLDGSWGHRLQEVHLSQRRVELRHCHVGSDVVRRAAVLGHEQSRCKPRCDR